DVLHGIPVTDPYRWLEDQNSPRTRKWLEEQTAYTRVYLDAIPGREPIRNRVSEFLSIPPVAEPWNVGDRYFFLRRHQASERHDPRPHYSAAFWHRFGAEQSPDREVFFAGERPNLFLGILNSPEAQLLAFATLSTGKRRSTSIHLSTLSPGAVPKLLLHEIE